MSPVAENLAAEYRELKHGRGFVLLPWDVMAITGNDRVKFLHNFCTADVNSLQPGDGSEAFILNVKGKTLAFGYVVIGDESIFFVSAAGLAQGIAAHLDRYIIREDVQVADVSQNWRGAVTGLPLGELAKLVQAATPSGIYLSHAKLVFGDVPAVCVHSAVINESDCLLLFAAELQPQLVDWLVDHQFLQCSEKSFEIARIEQGTPVSGVDLDDQNLPQELGRDQSAISFTKGCYLGQETVARIDALGHVNKFFVKLQFSGDQIPRPREELLDGDKVIGQVTSACYSIQYDAPLALGFVRRGHEKTGTSLASTNCGPATVVQ